MKIVTILPVSRLEYLDRVLDSLVKQSYPEHPNLLVVVDGDTEMFIKVHNKVANLPLNSFTLVVKAEHGWIAAETIQQRRIHIAAIHNQIRGLIDDDVDYIFSIEDDGILPVNALSWLVTDIEAYPAAGLITGVELGRWGVPYVGAWRVNDIMDVKRISSMPSKVGAKEVEEIDACGLYCALIRADLYKQHEFSVGNGLGPDVNMALEFRQLGFKNYIDWHIPVTHLTFKNAQHIEIPATSEAATIVLEPLGNSKVWHSTNI